MKITATLALSSLLATVSAYPQRADSGPITPQEAFDTLLSLAGTWKVKDSPGDFRIAYEATAGGTVLLEAWMVGATKHSITVYHLDDERLIATHYCPQGNQPRLQLESASVEGKFHFSFLDATGMASPDEAHQHYLSYDFSASGETFTRSEKYLEKGVEETSSLVLVREG